MMQLLHMNFLPTCVYAKQMVKPALVLNTPQTDWICDCHPNLPFLGGVFTIKGLVQVCCAGYPLTSKHHTFCSCSFLHFLMSSLWCVCVLVCVCFGVIVSERDGSKVVHQHRQLVTLDRLSREQFQDDPLNCVLLAQSNLHFLQPDPVAAGPIWGAWLTHITSDNFVYRKVGISSLLSCFALHLHCWIHLC